MDEEWTKARQLERDTDRDRVFSAPINALSVSDKYMHMRYTREIEAGLYVGYLQFGMDRQKAAQMAYARSNEIVANWKNKTHTSSNIV